MEALNFDDLSSSGSAGDKASGAITFDDLPGGKSGGALTFDDIGSDEGGIMSTVGNIAKGAGERVTTLAGGFMRTLGNLPSPEEYINDLMYGDNRPANLPTRQQVTDTANEIAGKLESTKFGYEQGTSWEDFKSSPIKNFIPFALEQGLVSTPDMVAALTNLPAYIAARTGEMAQDRAENNNLDNATVEDLIKVMPGAVASSMLERIGAKGILADTAVKAASQLPKAVGKAALKEGTTEAGQELIEYGSTNIGTEAGFDPATAAERMAAGAVAGTGFGAAARTATAGIEAARGEPVVDPAAQPDGNPEYIRADQLDVPAKADSADILYGADPEVVRPETQEQQKAVEELAPVDPERLDSPRLTAEDRASPLPNDLIDDGKAVMDGSAPVQPVAEPLTSEEPVPASEPVQQAEAAPAVSVGQPAVTFDDIAADQTQAAPATPVEAAPAAAVTPTAKPATTASQPKLNRPQRMTPDGFPADRAGNVRKPKSIIEFLAERGGIRDPKGDLAAMGLTGGKGSFVGGSGSLVRKGGMPLDYARKLAVEAGYLTDTNGAGPSTSTVTDLLDAIDQDARNGRQFFSQADANHAVRWQQDQQARQDLEQYGSEQEYRFRQAVDQVTALTGAKADDPVAVDIAAMMAQDDVDFDTAAIAVERRIDEKLAGTGREYKFELPQSLKDIPFFGDAKAASARIDDGQFPGDTAADTGAVYEARNGSRGAGNPVQGSSTEGRPASTGRTGDGSRSVQADDGKRAQEPRSEVGADGKPQLVIPGAEQISQREQAQRKADEKLKPKVEQRDAGGMFGDDVNSPQFFDKPAPKVEKETSKVSEEGSKVSDEPEADKAPPKEADPAEKPMLSKEREGALSKDFKGDIDAITADLRARLDKLGLPDVALRVVPVIEGYSNGEKFTAHGSYFRGLIDISLQAPDKTAPLNHEAIHALKNLNAFTKTEWSMLSAKSKSDWMNRYGINEAYAESSEAVQIEEGIAAAYTEWADGREKAGAFARLFQKIRDIIASIGNALRGNGYDSVGKIFVRVESGDVGNSRFFKNDPDADGAKRFQLVKDPANQAEAKQVMQGFIARGQPIDRAIRLPFEVLGGINKDGTWKPALKVNEKLGSSGRTGLGIGAVIGAGIGTFAGGPIGTVVGGAAGATAGIALLRANISPTGRFGWMYPVAENARRGLIDRYGLSEEYVEADRSRQTSQRGVMQKAQDILQVLQNASVGPAEAKVLQAVLTGENVTDTEMMKVAAPIRKAIDELGAEAVSLGLISAESFERNRGAYLHRVYQKNEMDQSGVIAWASKFMSKKRVRIMGDQLKGRGIFWDVPLDKLMADVPGWLEGQTGTPANGQRFKVLDYIAGTSKDMLTGEEKETQTKRRVYLPADGPIPKKFQGSGWVDRGNWEVRKTGKDVTLWRDYTKDERTKMGEVLDARYTIAKTFMMMANDLSTGRFYKQVAENEEWAQIKPPAMEWREAADYGRFWNDPEIGWVRVPETTIANSGGKKRYGALSGMFVRAEIWRDLNEVDQMSKSGIWRTILTQWKINKALALDTPIPTPNGWTTMGDIRCGEQVFDENGDVCTVLEVKDIVEGRPCYEVIFSDGSRIVADEEHWWFTNHRNKGGAVRTTKEILETLAINKRGEAAHSIPVAQALVLPSSALPIDPYVLGAWLGDGDSAAPRISIGSLEAEEMKGLLRDCGIFCTNGHVDKRTGVHSIVLRGSEHQRQNSIRASLCELGLIGNKHVPAMYLRASTEQRLSLLQGLLDTDGWITEKGLCGFGTSSEALKDGMFELLCSLGLKPSVSTLVPSCNGKAGKQTWRIHFQAWADMPVFRLDKKKTRLRDRPPGRARSMNRQIVAINPVQSVPVRCISVSSKSQLYLAGDAMIPTHNTARSPVTHMNNIMSNMMFMDMADVRMQDLSKGIKSFIKGDAEYMAARDAGAFGGDMIAQELRKEVLQPILDDIAKAGADGKNPLLARMGMLGTVADKIWTWAKVADDRMLTAYQMEDEVFRMATYLRRRSLGDSVEVSAKHAREQFLDYDIRAPWVNAARNSVLPFISYSYRAIPKIAENVMNRPWKVAKYFALAYAANMLAYMWDDGDDGEDRERASLRDEEQGYTWFGIPRMMRMPYRDADGMPVFLDVRRWIPSGDVFDTNQGQSAIPVPSSLQLGGPLLLAFEFALNKQSFTGNEITNDLTDTSGDKAAKVGDWLWKSWMPSAAWVPNSWYWEKIENALKGAEDYSGRKYSLPEAALSSVGIKLKPQNVEDGLGWKQRAFKEVERELRTEGRRLANKRERGLISQSEFDKSMAQLSEKFTNLGEKAKDLGEQARPKPKP